MKLFKRSFCDSNSSPLSVIFAPNQQIELLQKKKDCFDIVLDIEFNLRLIGVASCCGAPSGNSFLLEPLTGVENASVAIFSGVLTILEVNMELLRSFVAEVCT